MSIKILVAMDKEARLLNIPEAEIFVTGIGGENTIKTLNKLVQEKKINVTDKIINVGFVGSNIFPIGSILEIGSVTLYDKESKTFKLNDKGIRCFTADTFIETNNKISAVDMELWYICNFGFKDVKSYKIISDNLSLDKYLNFDFNKDWQILNERVKNEFTTT